jgi:tRNA A37 threonylcarbamoyladenosine modification protein TsaB
LLMALEEGNLLRALGRDAEAAAVYQRIWQNGKQGRYSGLHYEAAALSLAEVLRMQKDFAGATAAYGEVGTVSDADPEMLQKADLGAGEIADLAKNREAALRKYQAVLARGSETPQADAARKYLKDPYQGEGN